MTRDFAVLWEQRGFLTSNEGKLEMSFRSMTYCMLCPHARLDSPEAKGNHLADVSAKNTALGGTSDQTCVMVQRDVSPNYDLEKLARDV